MIVCDVCDKKSLVCERVGSVNICVACFAKINGPLWRYRKYEKISDAKNQKEAVLSNAARHNYPYYVLDGITEFFDRIISEMNVCDACGDTAKNPSFIGSCQVCNKCYAKINVPQWKTDRYSSNDDVEMNRRRILNIADSNNFPPAIIDEINAHFDKYLTEGLIRISDSSKGQTLKVYETHCVLVTKMNFDENAMAKEYGKLLKAGNSNDGLLSKNEAKSLAKSVLSNGVVGAGINFAASAVIDVAADIIAPSKGIFRTVRGSYTIDYSEFSAVEFQKAGKNKLGYIRFVNGEDSENDIIFFFDSNDKNEELYHFIQEQIDAAKKNTSAKDPEPEYSSVAVPTPAPAPGQSFIVQTTVADEILKFKNLLDMGAITQEEFDAKKKELLGL